MINVTKPSLPPLQEYEEEIKSIWENVWLTNFGPKHKEFEEKLKEFLGAGNIVLFANGHQALLALIKVLLGNEASNLPNDKATDSITSKKREIITTPFTFASTTHAIADAGFIPVFADIDPESLTLSPKACEAKINENTAAILPVHVYGHICDVEGFEALSKKYNIPVIYDAAHAFGVEYKGKAAAGYGTASMLSFHATKIFNSIEGGAVVTDDNILAEKLKKYENFALENGEFAENIGTNAKMNEFSAAMGICNLRHLDEYLAKRRHVATKYRELLAGKIELLEKQENATENFAYFPVFAKDEAQRDLIKQKLAENEIFARRYFYPLTSEFECYKNCPGASDVKNAKNISKRVLCLPFYADLEDSCVEKICGVIEKCI